MKIKLHTTNVENNNVNSFTIKIFYKVNINQVSKVRFQVSRLIKFDRALFGSFQLKNRSFYVSFILETNLIVVFPMIIAVNSILKSV